MNVENRETAMFRVRAMTELVGTLGYNVCRIESKVTGNIAFYAARSDSHALPKPFGSKAEVMRHYPNIAKAVEEAF